MLNKAINYDYKGLYEHEISLRKATSFPPFADVIRVLVSCEDEGKTLEKTKKAYEEIRAIYGEEKDKFYFLGCMKAPLKRLQGKYRYQILMRVRPNEKGLIDKIYKVVKETGDKNTLIYLEINPTNLS